MTRSILYLAISILSGVAAQLILKRGTGQVSLHLVDWWDVGTFFRVVFGNLALISYGFLAAVSAFTWVLAVAHIDISVAFPVTIGLLYALVMLGAWVFLGEAMSVPKVIGAVLVVAGVGLIMLRG
jgi:multidrug transporter EmrE-like cation transporter